MSIDPLNEDLISLVEASALFPTNSRGKKPHVCQLYRYTTAGLKGVVLESLQCGGARCTSRQALVRFFMSLTAAANRVPTPTRTPNQRKSAIERAEAELAKDGI